MSTAFAFPYKTIPEELCVLGPWERIDANDAVEEVGEYIAGWDYDSHMEFGRSIELSPVSVVSSIGLEQSEAHLSILVTAQTGPTSYRWLVSCTNVPRCAEWQKDIRFTVNSIQLAHRLSLTTEVVLACQVPKAAKFAPSKLGSRLYRDIQTIQLEGSLGRFPMEMIEFGKGLPYIRSPEAFWFLDWEPSRPEAQFLGTVLLYINSSHAEVANLIRAAEPTILSILRCDVIRTMCQALLQNDEFLSNYAEYDTDTVGGQVREWLLLAFGDEKPELLQAKLLSSPGRFEARIQSLFS